MEPRNLALSFSRTRSPPKWRGSTRRLSLAEMRALMFSFVRNIEDIFTIRKRRLGSLPLSLKLWRLLNSELRGVLVQIHWLIFNLLRELYGVGRSQLFDALLTHSEI